MIKAFSVIAIAAFIAAALTVLPGFAPEVEASVPHALANPGPEPAEVLTLFGPQGERLHVRARPTAR